MSNKAPETIGDDMVVSVAYTLTVDGDNVESASADDPLEYLHGFEEIIPGLEKKLTGKKVGDKFSVTLAPEDAYGEYDEDDVEELEIDDFPDDEVLVPGMELLLEDEDGYIMEGTIKSVEGDVITVDMNPIYAGKSVTYDIEILGLRHATKEEIEHGHVHSDHDQDE